jgi:hypothetical protein
MLYGYLHVNKRLQSVRKDLLAALELAISGLLPPCEAPVNQE